MELFIENALHNYSYLVLFGLSFGYFLFLYFGIGALFLFACKTLEKNKILTKIKSKDVPKEQIYFEIKHSIKSIIIFGLSPIPISYLIRNGSIELLPNTGFNILTGIILLTLWNEIHFYVVHRTMHQKLMMKHVHVIHHRTHIPTVYSVYSFHWLEALLLSTVPLTIIPFIPFSIIAVFIYPFVSILLNFAGHCNYRFGNGKGTSWKLFGTYHNEHHSSGRKNYGFTLNFLDKLFSKHNK
ncbi:MAG: sterol desaturase family protein [Flavobacteriaceae bacterium]|nr:sterol desaturase family protein [Flavobacteriaceae bacterium]